MLIKTKTARDIPSSEITPETVYRNRRDFMRDATQVAVGLGVATSGLLSPAAQAQAAEGSHTAEQLNLATKPAWL